MLSLPESVPSLGVSFVSEVNMKRGKELVKSIFDDIGKTAGDASRLARALKKIAGDLYTEAERFIFELVQNADDLPNETGKVEMKFIFLQEHIAIVHNGQCFSDKDVEAISDIGDSTKESDSAKTGYKGIGFKSVFSHSDCVYIHSGDYSFRYDKKFYDAPDKIPWEIKPIWTEKTDFPQEIKDLESFFNYPVLMVLQVGSQKINEYKTTIRKLFSELRFMLFLRHVIKIDVEGLGENISISRETRGNYHEIYENDCLKNRWLVKNFELDIDQEVKEKIQDDPKIPDKLKQATKTKISFAAKIENEKLVGLSSDESVLFTYLPTNVKDYKFPFLVNADFLTTANRQDLHRDSDWNAFIFESIAYYLFKFLEWICNDEKPYRNNFTDLIVLKYRTYGKLQQSFDQGWEKGLKNIAFIPSDESEKVLKVNEAIIDQFGITKIIDDSHKFFKKILFSQGLFLWAILVPEFVDKNIENIKKLEGIGVKNIRVQDLVQFFKNSSFKNNITPKKNIEIIIHFKDKLHLLVQNKIPIIMDESGKMIFSGGDDPVYCQPSREDKKLLSFDDFYFLHPELEQYRQKDSEFRKLLEKLQVKQFNGVEIIRARIRSQKYLPKELTVESFINYLRFIFKYRQQLTPSDLQNLSPLEILYKVQESYYYGKASECYLSNYYRPKYSLENIGELIELEAFITSEYCEQEQEQDIDDWRKFFISIGIIKPEGLDIIRQKIFPLIDNKQINEKNAIPITRFIFSVFRSDVITDNQIKNKLNNLPLMSSNGLQLAKDCILSNFYNDSNQNSNFIKEIPILNLVSQDYYTGNENLQEWREFFLKIGVKELNGVALIRYKLNLINTYPDLINQDNAIQITREIFSQINQLSQEDFIRLYNLKLLLKNGELAEANQCYLSNPYRPQQDLESLFAETDFHAIVSHEYIDNNNLEDWKSFFLKIGVAEKIRIFDDPQDCNYQVLEPYFQWLNQPSNLIYLNPTNTSYRISNVLLIDSFHDYSGNYDYYNKIWKYIIKTYDISYLDQKFLINNKPFPSLFEFQVKSIKSIPCTDGQCHQPSEVYSHSLKPYLKNSDLPISSLFYRN